MIQNNEAVLFHPHVPAEGVGILHGHTKLIPLSRGLCFTQKWCIQCCVSLCCSRGYKKLPLSTLSVSECLLGPISLHAKCLPTPHLGLTHIVISFWTKRSCFLNGIYYFITDCGGVCGGKFLRVLWENVSCQPDQSLISYILLLFQIINGKITGAESILKAQA